jgi:hypothetical protein
MGLKGVPFQSRSIDFQSDSTGASLESIQERERLELLGVF